MFFQRDPALALDRRMLLGGAASGLGALISATGFGSPLLAAAGPAASSPSARSVPISLIGLPYLMGTRAHNSMYGMAEGPLQMLKAENAPAALRSYFTDVEVEMIDSADEPAPPLPQGDQMARILAENTALAAAVRSARERGRLPIMSLGTCSGTLGVVAGLSAEKEDIGLIWFDAHADAETPDSTRSGFIEGMVVPMIAGQTWKAYCQALPGFRPIDESRMISVDVTTTPWPLQPKRPGSPMGTVVHKNAIGQSGLASVLKPALDQLRSKCGKVMIHIDADTIDPAYYKNFKYRPNITGLSPEIVKQAFDMIADRFEIVAFDLAAFDPNADTRGPSVLSPLMLAAAMAAARSRNRT